MMYVPWWCFGAIDWAVSRLFALSNGAECIPESSCRAQSTPNKFKPPAPDTELIPRSIGFLLSGTALSVALLSHAHAEVSLQTTRPLWHARISVGCARCRPCTSPQPPQFWTRCSPSSTPPPPSTLSMCTFSPPVSYPLRRAYVTTSFKGMNEGAGSCSRVLSHCLIYNCHPRRCGVGTRISFTWSSTV